MTYIIQDKETFKNIQVIFRQGAHARNVSSAEHLFYNIIRGKPVTHGFTPVTNTNKLKHGMYPDHGYNQARNEFRWHIQYVNKGWGAAWGVNMFSKYKDLITEDQWKLILETVK